MSLPARIEETLGRAERGLSSLVLAAMVLLPLAEIAGRRFPLLGIPGSILIVQHLTLVLAFLGAALAAESDRLLALSTATFVPPQYRDALRLAANVAAAALTSWLTLAAIDFVRSERDSGRVLALGVPAWVVLAVMPFGLALIAARLALRASNGWRGRAVAGLAMALPFLLESHPAFQGEALLVPGLILIVVATALGLPIFAALGGVALLLFRSQGAPIASVPVDAYELTSYPVLPAVPLFTLTGYILGQGGSSDRMVRVFNALFGWMPGGTAVVTTLVFAFFTSFTGASGVTILSLGGLLLPVLLKSGYPGDFSLGLVTVSGSIGLLLPPSLPVILYAVYAQQRVDHLLLGGIIPGTLLVLLIAIYGAQQGALAGAGRTPFRLKEAARAAWEGKWELALPFVVLIAIFGGFATMVEAAALTVLYSLFIECVVYRDLSARKDLPKVFNESATLVGGFLIILAMALGLTDYFNFAEIPTKALELVRSQIEAPWLFLLALNFFLLIVGALMDIYSAIFVFVPLVTPMAAHYGIHPIHLGIIFLANLELGYLTPPMGENLFLAAYRFDKPVMEVFRCTIPFYLILAVAVLLITYVPALTLWPVQLFGP